MKGEANYNIRDQVVQIKSEDRTYSFGEKKVKSMSLQFEEKQHEFRLVAMKGDRGDIELMLLELIYQSSNGYSYFKRHTASKKAWSGGAPVGAVPVAPGVAAGVSVPTQTDVAPVLNKDSFTSHTNPLSRRGFEKLLINYEGDKMELNRKNFFGRMNKHEKKVRKYTRQNNFNLQVDASVIAIMKYYDDLVEKDADSSN